MSGRKSRRRRPRPETPRQGAVAPVEEGETGPPAQERRPGPFGGVLFGSADSPMPPMIRSLGRGLLSVVVQPLLLGGIMAFIGLTWLGLLAMGFEGRVAPLAQLLALPPISTLFDSGTAQSMFGLGLGALVAIGVAFVIRAVVFAALTGLTVEALEDGRVSLYGAIRGLPAIPTILAAELISFSALIAGNTIWPLLGPGISFLGIVATLVGSLFFLGFAPAAAVHDPRGVVETLRRSWRAARLPGSNQLIFCSLYFLLSVAVLNFFSPGGSEITANPPLAAWVFLFAMNVLHVGFVAAFAYRWIVAEPAVPEHPIPRRRPARAPAARPRARR